MKSKDVEIAFRSILGTLDDHGIDISQLCLDGHFIEEIRLSLKTLQEYAFVDGIMEYSKTREQNKNSNV